MTHCNTPVEVEVYAEFPDGFAILPSTIVRMDDKAVRKVATGSGSQLHLTPQEQPMTTGKKTRVQSVKGAVVHDAATLARDYGYREIKAALRELEGGNPPGFDLNRDPRTKLKEDFAVYIIQTHGGAAVTKLLPVRGAQPTGVVVGQVGDGIGPGTGIGHGAGSGTEATKGDEPGEGQGEGHGKGDQPQPGQGDGKGNGQGDGEPKQGDGDGQGKPQQGDGKGGEKPADGQQGQGDGDKTFEDDADGEGQGQPQGQQPGEQGKDGQQQSQPEQQEHPLVAEVRKVIRDETAKGNILGPGADLQKVVQEAVQAITSYQPPKVQAPTVRVKAGHQHPAFEELADNAAAGNNVLMVGPAGCGKTTLGRNLSKVWRNKTYHRIPYTAGASESWVLGRYLPTGQGGRFEYHVAKVLEIHTNGGVNLHDEVDAGDPNMLLILNGLTDDGDFINPLTNQVHPRHKDTAHVAAANTWGWGGDTVYCGRNKLDAATVDRWYPIPVDYDLDLEKRLGRKEVVDFVWSIRERIRQQRVARVLSTRAIIKSERALAAGRPWAEVRERLLGGWTRDERAKVGL